MDLIDRYVTDLDTENKLTPETFIKLASAIPNEKRRSNDKLMQALLNLLKKGKQICLVFLSHLGKIFLNVF